MSRLSARRARKTWSRKRSLAGRLALDVIQLLNRVVPKRADQSVLIGVPDLEDGLMALADELLARGRDVVLTPSSAPLPSGVVDERVRVVPRARPSALWAFLRSAEVYTTHGVYGDLEGPRAQKLAYVWHGEPTGKLIERYQGGPAKPAAIAPTTSSIAQAFRCAEFGLPPWLVPVTGAPRNDRMMRADRSPDHPLRTGRTAARLALLWLPTYRSAGSGQRRTDSTRGYAGLPFDADELRAIDAHMRERDVAVFVKLHPLAVGQYDLATTAIVPITDADLHRHGLTTYTALPRFDGLITDVSSIWIDHLLLDLPVLFAFPDIEAYRQSRGFALEPFDEWVAGPVTTDVGGLLDEIDDLVAGHDRHAERRARARRLLHHHIDDGAARRVVDAMEALTSRVGRS